MAAPIGNQNAKGNSGGKPGRSGRSSVYKEISDARMLWNIWNGKYSKRKLKKILASKKYGVFHIFAAKCMSGDMKAILPLLNKLYANKQSQEISFGDKRVDESLDLIKEAILNESKKDSTNIHSGGNSTNNNADTGVNNGHDSNEEIPEDTSNTSDTIR